MLPGYVCYFVHTYIFFYLKKEQFQDIFCESKPSISLIKIQQFFRIVFRFFTEIFVMQVKPFWHHDASTQYSKLF